MYHYSPGPNEYYLVEPHHLSVLIYSYLLDKQPIMSYDTGNKEHQTNTRFKRKHFVFLNSGIYIPIAKESYVPATSIYSGFSIVRQHGDLNFIFLGASGFVSRIPICWYMYMF